MTFNICYYSIILIILGYVAMSLIDSYTELYWLRDIIFILMLIIGITSIVVVIVRLIKNK